MLIDSMTSSKSLEFLNEIELVYSVGVNNKFSDPLRLSVAHHYFPLLQPLCIRFWEVKSQLVKLLLQFHTYEVITFGGPLSL